MPSFNQHLVSADCAPSTDQEGKDGCHPCGDEECMSRQTENEVSEGRPGAGSNLEVKSSAAFTEDLGSVPSSQPFVTSVPREPFLVASDTRNTCSVHACMKTNANTHKLFNNNNKCNAVCRGHYLERSAGWGRTSAVISAQCTRLRCSGVRAARETSRTLQRTSVADSWSTGMVCTGSP